MKIRAKICYIQNHEEARLAINMGASAIGLLGHMPKLKIKELGGNGRIHNWQVGSAICTYVKIPV